ncbi:hypothetical protein [Flavobacterium sp.]|uniref:hypothetical protein n=1 Tax=Flavobacterium sp. TaxID=239 RepID=UPI00286A9582|nr:hypothetical protein [Flavobacterium sp.]
MKNSFLALLFIAGIVSSSCSSSDDEDTTPAPVVGSITGIITTNTTFPSGTYTLAGIVKINPGVTVTFDAGSTITCDIATGDNALVVLNGGKLIVNGTASQPVVFTEKNKVPGNWGGIIMYGDAPITAASGAATAASEDGNVQTYGGTNPTHNGGTLRYVRVEYAGKKLGDGQKENNAFTFYSCGSGTVLDHLVAYKGADDGYEFFGGTVSATNLVSYGNYDDAFDWQDGWKGQLNSNWYAYQTGKGNFGMEVEASNNNNAFGPKVVNITLKRATGTTPEVDTDVQVDAFQFKKQGNGEYDNIVVDGYLNYTVGATLFTATVVRILDTSTNTDQVNGGKLKLTNVKITNTSLVDPTGAAGISVSFPVGNFTTSQSATGAVITNGSWSNVDGTNLIQ